MVSVDYLIPLINRIVIFLQDLRCPGGSLHILEDDLQRAGLNLSVVTDAHVLNAQAVGCQDCGYDRDCSGLIRHISFCAVLSL